MKTAAQTNSVRLASSLGGIKKIDVFVFKPLKAGFKGFTITIMLLFIINLISYTIGNQEVFKMDILDLFLAGLGFGLQTFSTLLRNFIK